MSLLALLVWLLPLGTSDDAAPALVRPNIVLVLTDDQSIESVSRMPYVSGRPDWVSFDNAFLNVALCCPSRASILSGQYSHHTRVEHNSDGPLLRDADTVGAWLRNGGYRTAFMGKYLNGYPFGRGPYVPPGWDDWQVFQKVGYFDYTLNENGTTVARGSSANDYSTDVLARRASRFITRQSGPFFLVVAPYAPHGPRTAAPRHRAAFTGTSMPRSPSLNEKDVSDKPVWVQGLAPRDAEQMDNQRRKQYRSLLAVDDMVRDLFTTLRARGQLDNTVFFFVTDNGYSFGEHRHVRKTCPYEECIRTPLLVRYPGQGAKRVRSLAQNVDLAPTMAELGGVRPTIPQDGRSLVPLLRGTSTSWRREVLLRWAGLPPGVRDPVDGVEIPAFWGLRTERYKYVELATGERELYDLRSDPNELANRAQERSSAKLIAELRARLGALRGT